MLVVTHSLEPGTIQRTKAKISTITISDAELRDLGGSIVFIRDAQHRGVTGFLWTPRYVVTTSSLVDHPGAEVVVTRRKGRAGERQDVGRAVVVDTRNRIAVIDMGKSLHDDALPDRRTEELSTFDKVFALVYADTNYISIREGRVLHVDVNLGEGRRIIAVDMAIALGMAGSPVFSKDGSLVGMVTGAKLDAQVGHVVPVREIEYSFEGLGG